MDLIIFPLLMVGMYLLLVRPQQKRLRAQRELIASIAVGDEVVTAGGIIGTVRVLTDDRISLEVADGVELQVLRGAISRTIQPATTTDAPRPGHVADLDQQDLDQQDVDQQDVDPRDVDRPDVDGPDGPDGPDATGSRGDR
jgi:preprotein translocase subunit YajC